MNSIIERQNSENNIARLAAQRQLYNDVSFLDFLSIVLTVIIPIVLTVVQDLIKENTWIKIAGCCFSIAMIFLSSVLSSAGKKKKELAASIQQVFDLDVYQMPWDKRLFGAQKNLNSEVVSSSHKILKNKVEKAKLLNWYTTSIESLPQLKAIELCQRINCNWDIKLRKKYKVVIMVVLIIIITIPMIICLANNKYARDLLLLYVMILPAIKWFINMIKGLDEDIIRIKAINDSLILVEDKTMEQLQFIQRDIYNNRKTVIKIPNWFYKKYKAEDEDRTKKTIEMDG